MSLLPGTEVIARQLKWEVVTSQQLGQQTLYRLRGLEGALLGQELDLLHPFESITPVTRQLNPKQASPLPNWLVYHQAFLLEQALGEGALLAVQPGRLRLEAYQLIPVFRAIRLSRVRLGLFDSVGLGKTIQGGLVITELMARRLAHRILVVCPAGPLLEQWKLEMTERFGLRLEVINRDRLQEIRRTTELGANPFDYIPLGLASLDFLKQEKILQLLERATYDLIIIDEAHHCMDLGATSSKIADRSDSQRRRLAEVLARQCDALLLLTATPHDGNDRSFASLCELLDPSLVDGKGNLRGTNYKRHVVRRLKRHIIDPVTGECRFKERVVNPCPVGLEPEKFPQFAQLQKKLLELLAPQLKRAFRAKRYSDVLAFIALLKRSVSTAEACRVTLTTVAQRFQQLLTQGSEDQESRRQRIKTLREYHRKLERFGTVSVEEEEEKAILEAEEIAQHLADLSREVRSLNPTISRISNLVEALDELVELAEQAVYQDPKIEYLITQIQAIRREEKSANILIYTEYIDSQRAVFKGLEKAKIGKVLMMNGDDSERIRGEITERFRREKNLVLVSTDTAAEGLNLHQRCHHLIHVELPFNPNRIEQRNGRIDRFGQEFTPYVYYLYLRGTFEERILLRLIAKYERQRSRLTFVPNTLGVTTASEATTEKLLKGLMDEDERLFQTDTPLFSTISGEKGLDFPCFDENEGADPATQELLAEIDRSLKTFEAAAKTHSWLSESGLNAENQLLTAAKQLQQTGNQISGVDLLSFVKNAIFLDGGDIKEVSGVGDLVSGVGDLVSESGDRSSESGERILEDKGKKSNIFEVILPPSWNYGLGEMSGYDEASRRLRLTTDIEITTDSHDNPVGYLGRAHPLVRRALDRVRNLSFGGGNGQDPRVSAVKADVNQPSLLLTYLGRINSQKGRELERVIAVKVDGQQEQFYDSFSQWMPYCDRRSAIRTTDVWERYFQLWWEDGLKRGESNAQAGFQPIVSNFISQYQKRLQQELMQLEQWLKQRVEEILPTNVSQVQQLELFGGDLPTQAPNWANLTDPCSRLTAYATDKREPAKCRNEAEGVLRLYHHRQQDLEMRLSLKTPEVILLGALMLIPH